ncbi:DNA-binding protein [Pseudomonas lalucatii]|uniref:DNA-binding protein n=1 Tax=Pseudomonas lalucatii TaxID=1424203 RepID=A0ABS5PZL8_9PSED|nr:DNA-binding protein [Pseudomonas lalucatii]MBS7661927.1 DNA-binding protein [Pseudomonas lalucatii]
MSEGISDRGLLLLERASLKELAESGGTEYVRWQNIKRGKARIGANEIEILGRVFPRYRWWLITGEVMPENDQTSPDYDEANRNLIGRNAG